MGCFPNPFPGRRDCRFVFSLFIHFIYTGLCSCYKNHTKETFPAFGTGLPGGVLSLDSVLWHRQASSTCRTHHGATEQGCPHCPHLGARRARFILGSKYQKGMCPEVGSKLVFAQQRDKRKGQELMPRKLQLNLRRNFFPVQ